MADNNETTGTGGDDLATIVADLQAQLEKVNGKNRELISEKQASRQAEAAARQQAEDAETTAAERNGDIETLKSNYKKSMDKLEGELRTIRVDNAIKDAVQAGNVNGPVMAKALTAILKEMTDYKDGLASIEGKSIQDYTRDYLAGEEGKHFVRAASNSGGGAQGSDGSKAFAFSKPPETAEQMNDFMRLSNEDKPRANALAASWNRPDLAS